MFERELKFPATRKKGEVYALLIRPGNASHLLVLSHGASTTMRHATLRAIAQAVADTGIATLRYNFPCTEHGPCRDSQVVCTETVRAAVAAARRRRSARRPGARARRCRRGRCSASPGRRPPSPRRPGTRRVVQDITDVDQIHLPPQALVGGVDADDPPVPVEPRVQVDLEFPLEAGEVLGR